jgi:GNAT superfamily N-acetyltransferase
VHLLEWFPASRDENVPPFECIVKVNHELSWEDIQRELRLLVRARSGLSGRPVVKTQGGGYRDLGLWTEEFIPGRTLGELLAHLSRSELVQPLGSVTDDRISVVWPFLVASCASLVVDFWNRTGRRVSLAHPAPTKLVLPPHDWQVGGRLVSVADRIPCDRLTDVLASIDRHILAPLRERYASSGVGPEWPLLFSAALEVLGEAEGVALLEAEAPWLTDEGSDESEGSPMERMGPAALRFVSSVQRRGFLPGRLRHAARRYRRWALLNPDATLEAQAATLDQIEAAYGLAELEAERSGSRMQLFRHTVFRGGEGDFVKAFDDLIGRTLAGTGSREEWRAAVATLREEFPLDEREEFFLARMLYPHVDPRGRAVLVREEDPAGTTEAGVEVEHRDSVGDIFRIRRPANPNETSALYRVFRASNFRRIHGTGSHDLLVVTDERARVVGGLIHRRMSETYVVLDWIVLSRRRRGRGIGSVLLIEFLERLRVQGVKAVSTGFFRPSFFARFGFGVDPRYAGLVRFLEPEEAGTATPPPA